MTAMTLSVGVACMTSLLCLLSMPRPCQGHGYLYDPPARSTVWRHAQFAKYVPRNPTDNELNCGGRGHKCPLCGDKITNRENEVGGVYADRHWRPVTANWTQGEDVVIKVRLTAHHKGWQQFKLCPTNDFGVEATQPCLDQHPVYSKDSPSELHYDMTEKHEWYNVTFTLPKDVTCDLCVLQWKYRAANSWGYDPKTGKSGPGVGVQEEFYGCADVSIKPSSGAQPAPAQTQAPTSAPAATAAPVTPRPTTPRPAAPVVTTPRPTAAPKPVTSAPRPTQPMPNVMNFCRDYQLDDGIHIDPTSCSHYMECNKGNTVRMSCPVGTGFSPRYRTCDADFAC